MDRKDPLRAFRFRLDIENLAVAGFSDVAIAETVIEPVDYREGNDPPHLRKLTGLTKYGNVTLKAGLTMGTGALTLFQWHQEVSAGNVTTQRKRVTVIVQDEAGQDQARFVIADAWPTKYHSSDLNAKGNEVLIEMLELVNHGIERVS
jgi:phage tail-like protein